MMEWKDTEWRQVEWQVLYPGQQYVNIVAEVNEEFEDDSHHLFAQAMFEIECPAKCPIR